MSRKIGQLFNRGGKHRSFRDVSGFSLSAFYVQLA